MLRVGDNFENPSSGARIEVVRAPDEGSGTLEVARVVKPGTGRALSHVHLDYVERFVVEAGQATAKVDSRAQTLAAGDELAVPVGARHVNPYNAGVEDLLMRHSFEPASEFALAYIETRADAPRRDRPPR